MFATILALSLLSAPASIPEHPTLAQCRVVAVAVHQKAVEADAKMHTCFQTYGAIGCIPEFHVAEFWQDMRVDVAIRCKGAK